LQTSISRPVGSKVTKVCLTNAINKNKLHFSALGSDKIETFAGNFSLRSKNIKKMLLTIKHRPNNKNIISSATFGLCFAVNDEINSKIHFITFFLVSKALLVSN